jgi:hypothetical protein
MKGTQTALKILLTFVLGVLGGTTFLLAQDGTAPASGVPVHTLVTVEAKHGKDVPAVNRDDVRVIQGHDRDQVADWVPLQGNRAGLELFILIDDASDPSISLQFNDIRNFINNQPATTLIGVGYMRDGAVQVLQNPTADHAAAAKSLRIPMGFIGASTSPYFSVVDLMKRWPESQMRREILMITDGIDRFYGGGIADPYVDTAIEEAQKRNIVIFSIYARGTGHFGHSLWRVNWGQNYLSQVSDETGGESYYFLSAANAVSFAPYLEDLSLRLNHQYLLTFLAKPSKKAGLEAFKLQTEVPNADLVSSDRVWVPAQ